MEKISRALTITVSICFVAGGKIQVKIITAGYYDDKDDSLHVLSDKDSEVFRNMIVSIIVSTHLNISPLNT